jgi:hypothetical protein
VRVVYSHLQRETFAAKCTCRAIVEVPFGGATVPCSGCGQRYQWPEYKAPLSQRRTIITANDPD